MVARVWAKHGLKPQRLDRYMASNDPDFERKAADIIGQYVNPPAHAAVFLRRREDGDPGARPQGLGVAPRDATSADFTSFSPYAELISRRFLRQKRMAKINQKNSLSAEPHETIPVVLAVHVKNTEWTRRSEFGKLYTEVTGNGFERFL
jgi:hypothetical protein